MQIYITGPAGSGKSTLAKKLWEKFSIPVTHLDELLWNPDWTENPNYQELQKQVIQQRDWIIEWPSCSIVRSIPEATSIFILDYPPISNVKRVIFRWFQSIFGFRKRIGVVLPDKITFDFLKRTYVWRTRQLPRLLENCKSAGNSSKIIYLHDFQNSFEECEKHLKDKKAISYQVV
jgi:adenylate kinase family enzyme